MTDTKPLLCDGCGQVASGEHVARRLQRLEWATRYRPVHIGTLLLGAAAPEEDAEFVYSPSDQWEGEGKLLLEAAGLISGGKPFEATLAEFQRGGLFVTHVLECPFEDATAGNMASVLENHLAGTLTRIRRSLKPKRLAPIAGMLAEFLPRLLSGNLGCAVLLDAGKPFALDAKEPNGAALRLREALASQGAARLGAS